MTHEEKCPVRRGALLSREELLLLVARHPLLSEREPQLAARRRY
jgi:hypothetical protein